MATVTSAASASNETQTRIEKDTMGEIQVPLNQYWGAQTQRSINNFLIGNNIMPLELIYALTTLKKAAAITNAELQPSFVAKADIIIQACDLILQVNTANLLLSFIIRMMSNFFLLYSLYEGSL